jgi:AraC-like DNA-binding protein
VGVSTLHHRFKAATGTSPLQYHKRLRLEHARRLLLERGVAISEAAHAVGYTSPSQFSRDYRRHFAAAPRDDRFRMR